MASHQASLWEAINQRLQLSIPDILGQLMSILGKYPPVLELGTSLTISETWQV